MMQGMMGGKGKEIYPLLMNLPALSPERRAEVDRLGQERIREGAALLQTAHERLSNAIEAGDHREAEGALEQSRDAIGRVDSGVAAHRVLREGTSPQLTALEWFKTGMGLPPPGSAPAGRPWFHYVIILLLAGFGVTMIVLYVRRLKRADALLNKLATDSSAAVAAGGGPPAPGVPAPKAKADTAPSAKPNADPAAPAPAPVAPGAPPAAAAAAKPLAPTVPPPPVSPDIAPSKSNSWSGAMLVARIFQETSQVKTFRLADPAGGKLPFNYLPGQFLTFTVVPHGTAVKRSYTISSSPTHRDYCEATVRHEDRGMVSGYLHDRVHEGELLQVTAPSGKFSFTGQDGSSIVLISGGVGVTPMMAVVRYLTDRSWPGDIFFIYGCKADDDVIFREEIEYLQRRYPNLHVALVAERVDSLKWPHATGRITKELIAATVPEIASRHVHLCGPPPMMDAVKLMLAELGVQAVQIETEIFIGKERPQAPLPEGAPPAEAEGAAPADAPAAAQDSAASAAATPAIAAPAQAASATEAVVTFARSNKTAALPPSKTILEASEDVGVNIEYSCRVGTCGVCKTKLISGEVTMEVEDALEAADKAQNTILACQAKATSAVSVDA